MCQTIIHEIYLSKFYLSTTYYDRIETWKVRRILSGRFRIPPILVSKVIDEMQKKGLIKCNNGKFILLLRKPSIN